MVFSGSHQKFWTLLNAACVVVETKSGNVRTFLLLRPVQALDVCISLLDGSERNWNANDDSGESFSPLASMNNSAECRQLALEVCPCKTPWPSWTLDVPLRPFSPINGFVNIEHAGRLFHPECSKAIASEVLLCTRRVLIVANKQTRIPHITIIPSLF